MTPPIAVFDLDGTLIDTAPDLLDSLNHCLLEEGLVPAELSDLRHLVGFGARVMIERAFAERERRVAGAELERLFDVFLEHYHANMPGRSRPFPGAVEALDRLAASGFTLAVCTNKFEQSSVTLLTALGLAPRLAAICGGDSFAFRKPDPRHLLETIEQAGGDPLNAVMVGDSRTDIDTAKAAGVPVVAVDFGYTDQPVQVFAPTRVISHFDELTPESVAELIATASGTPPRTHAGTA